MPIFLLPPIPTPPHLTHTNTTPASTGNICTVRCINTAAAGPFGGCFAVQQTDITANANTPSNIKTAQTLAGVNSQIAQNVQDLPKAVLAIQEAPAEADQAVFVVDELLGIDSKASATAAAADTVATASAAKAATTTKASAKGNKNGKGSAAAAAKASAAAAAKAKGNANANGNAKANANENGKNARAFRA